MKPHPERFLRPQDGIAVTEIFSTAMTFDHHHGGSIPTQSDSLSGPIRFQRMRIPPNKRNWFHLLGTARNNQTPELHATIKHLWITGQEPLPSHFNEKCIGLNLPMGTSVLKVQTVTLEKRNHDSFRF
jgi:hypothetical protein